MKEIIVEEVLDIINASSNLKITNEQLNENLITLGMDSITFIQIIVGLEETFGCEIPDSKLLVSEMDTVQKIIDVLQALYDEKSM